MRNTARRWARELAARPFLAVLLVVTTVAVPGYARMEAISARTSHAVDCVEHWVGVSTARTGVLSQAADERQGALDALLEAAATATAPSDRERIRKALRAYVAKARAYRETADRNPVPRLPSRSGC